LILKYHQLVSNIGFNCSLRRFSMERAAEGVVFVNSYRIKAGPY